jgi:hypothetical protein
MAPPYASARGPGRSFSALTIALTLIDRHHRSLSSIAQSRRAGRRRYPLTLSIDIAWLFRGLLFVPTSVPTNREREEEEEKRREKEIKSLDLFIYFSFSLLGVRPTPHPPLLGGGRGQKNLNARLRLGPNSRNGPLYPISDYPISNNPISNIQYNTLMGGVRSLRLKPS